MLAQKLVGSIFWIIIIGLALSSIPTTLAVPYTIEGFYGEGYSIEIELPETTEEATAEFWAYACSDTLRPYTLFWHTAQFETRTICEEGQGIDMNIYNICILQYNTELCTKEAEITIPINCKEETIEIKPIPAKETAQCEEAVADCDEGDLACYAHYCTEFDPQGKKFSVSEGMICEQTYDCQMREEYELAGEYKLIHEEDVWRAVLPGDALENEARYEARIIADNSVVEMIDFYSMPAYDITKEFEQGFITGQVLSSDGEIVKGKVFVSEKGIDDEAEELPLVLGNYITTKINPTISFKPYEACDLEFTIN